jgi:thymidylate kinase
MRNGQTNTGKRLEETRVVEIVGPAGAGKSTLYQALDCHPDSLRLENFPDVRKIADARFFILNGLELIPSLLGLYRPGTRQLTRREFAWMAILNGWAALLHKETRADNKVIILDQGPVYLMAELRIFGPESLRQKAAGRLWQDFYDRWADTLDMVVWLDAPDEVLFDRIRIRQQEHIMKTEPAETAYEFLGRYRVEYESILSILTAKMAGLKVLRFDTTYQQSQDIVIQFLSELDCRKKVM